MLHYAVSKASSNFTREDYRQLLRFKQRGVSPTPPYGGLLVLVLVRYHLIEPEMRLRLLDPQFRIWLDPDMSDAAGSLNNESIPTLVCTISAKFF